MDKMVNKFLLLLVLVSFSSVFAEDNIPIYSLDQCIERAVVSSNRLSISEQQVFSAKYGLNRAKSAFLPDLSLSRSSSTSERTDFDYQIDPYNNPTLVQDFDSESSYSSNSISSNLALFQGGSRFGALKSARNTLNSAESDAAYNKQVVVEGTASAYFDLVRYKELEIVAEESKDLAKRELEKTEILHKIGSATRSDVLQAQVRFEQTQLDLLRATNSVKQAFAQLAYVMNMPLVSKFDIDMSLLDGENNFGELNELYEHAINNRYDLKSLEFQVEARVGDVTSATAGLLPSVSLFSSYSRSVNESEFRWGAQESDNLSYGYSISWNVFDRLQSFSGRKQAKANQRIAEYNLQQAQLDVQLEVRQLYNVLLESDERLKLSSQTVESASEELRLASEKFKVGAGTMLEKITAQVNLTSAKADVIQAKCDIMINSLKLERAIGGTLDRLVDK